MNNKRLQEIASRKAEIRSALDTDAEINLEEIKSELEALEQEEIAIRQKAEIAEKINDNKIETREIDKKTGDKMENLIDSTEYRQAFKDFVVTGKMKEEFRATAMQSANTAVIPTETLDRIVEKLEIYGNLYNLVSKVSYPAGVAIPTANMGLVASWTAEGTTADKQAVATASISFNGYKLQTRVAVSMEVAVKSISAFYTALVENVSKAMIQAIEAGIVSGDGSGKMKGIVTETVDADQVVTVADMSYDKLIEIEAAVPAAYENNAVFVMAKKSYMAFVGMVDKNGQPVAQVNIGLNGKPERTLLGRTVVLTDQLPAFASATAGDVFAFVYDMSNYLINSAYDITIRKYIDEDTDDEVTKATMILDGKCVDKNGLVLVKKG